MAPVSRGSWEDDVYSAAQKSSRHHPHLELWEIFSDVTYWRSFRIFYCPTLSDLWFLLWPCSSVYLLCLEHRVNSRLSPSCLQYRLICWVSLNSLCWSKRWALLNSFGQHLKNHRPNVVPKNSIRYPLLILRVMRPKSTWNSGIKAEFGWFGSRINISFLIAYFFLILPHVWKIEEKCKPHRYEKLHFSSFLFF